MSTDPRLTIADSNAVRTLTLNRAEKRNALDTQLIGALLAALDAAAHAEGIGAVVLTGAGPIFSAGADLGEFRDAGAETAARNDHRSDLLLELLVRFGHLRKPVIAALNGSAFGAGAAIALAADMVVMGRDAKIGYPETRHGMIPSLMVGNLMHHAGRKATFELLAGAEPIGAERALQLGLANSVVDTAAVLAEATRVAVHLAALDRFAIGGTKLIINACADLPLEEALRESRVLGKRLSAERNQA